MICDCNYLIDPRTIVIFIDIINTRLNNIYYFECLTRLEGLKLPKFKVCIG